MTVARQLYGKWCCSYFSNQIIQEELVWGRRITSSLGGILSCKMPTAIQVEMNKTLDIQVFNSERGLHWRQKAVVCTEAGLQHHLRRVDGQQRLPRGRTRQSFQEVGEGVAWFEKAYSYLEKQTLPTVFRL